MEYTIKKLAGLSGVSTRTLRYYDEIGLLKPARVASNGYRIYGQAQVDLLQQILFYRALEVPLEEIRRMLSDSSFDRRRALEGHLHALEVRKKQVETQIATVRHTLAAMKGERTMTDQEKFAGLRDRFLEENQRRYGPELEARYGKETVDAAQDKAAAPCTRRRISPPALPSCSGRQWRPATPAARRPGRPARSTGSGWSGSGRRDFTPNRLTGR